MRKLNFEDAFRLSEIIDKMGIKIDLNSMMDNADNAQGDKQAFLGGQIALMLISKLHKAKDEVLELVASLTGDDIETVKAYSIKQIKDTFTDLFKQEDIVDFFKPAVS